MKSLNEKHPLDKILLELEEFLRDNSILITFNHASGGSGLAIEYKDKVYPLYDVEDRIGSYELPRKFDSEKLVIFE